MPRLDSKLESEGAEFLVCGLLLIEGIPSYKTYTQLPGYDIVATDPQRRASARIQVKSRWATDNDRGFPIRNFDCDFVVFVSLNRGFRYSKKVADPKAGRESPAFYVFPTEMVRKAQSPTSSWGKTYLKNIPDAESYRDGWDLIRKFLEETSRVSAGIKII
jgi:hypothetical protein